MSQNHLRRGDQVRLVDEISENNAGYGVGIVLNAVKNAKGINTRVVFDFPLTEKGKCLDAVFMWRNHEDFKKVPYEREVWLKRKTMKALRELHPAGREKVDPVRDHKKAVTLLLQYIGDSDITWAYDVIKKNW